MWAQAKIYVAVGLLIVTFAGGWYFGALSGRLGKANAEQRITAQKLDEVLKARQDDKKRAEKLQKTLDGLPKSEGKVREIIRENPSGCRFPGPVHDGLREAIRSGNASRKVSGPT